MTDTYICIQEPRFNGKLDEKGDRDVDWICINGGGCLKIFGFLTIH